MKKAKIVNKDLVLIGNEIRRLRLKRGFSQEAFAAEVEIDRGYYGAIERGEHNFSILFLLNIARALDINIGKIFKSL